MKFVEFNGKKIWYDCIDGVNRIIVKSVCEALNVDYVNQFKLLKEDDILVPALSKHTMQVPSDNQKREYVCLSEEYVYGWIFQIRSESPELKKYKQECYHILYNHFHRDILKRSEAYKNIIVQENIISEFEKKISNLEGYDEYAKAKSKKKRILKQLNKAVDNENSLFD
jgi:hypothetical protein